MADAGKRGRRQVLSHQRKATRSGLRATHFFQNKHGEWVGCDCVLDVEDKNRCGIK